MYFRNRRKTPSEVMIDKLLFQKPKITEKNVDTKKEALAFRNLRNCWYNESALNYPYDNLEERIKFASWKIMQCYYTVFSAIASLVCCHYKEKRRIEATLNLYANEFLCGKKKNFTIPPLNLFVNQQGEIPEESMDSITFEWGRHNSVPVIKSCLLEIQERNRLTAIPHYLRSLREDFTYKHMYLLFRLYGSSPKEKLDNSLNKIAFAYSLQTEVYLIKLFGWNALKAQFDLFSLELKDNLEIDSPMLVSRFTTYKKHFD